MDEKTKYVDILCIFSRNIFYIPHEFNRTSVVFIDFCTHSTLLSCSFYTSRSRALSLTRSLSFSLVSHLRYFRLNCIINLDEFSNRVTRKINSICEIYKIDHVRSVISQITRWWTVDVIAFVNHDINRIRFRISTLCKRKKNRFSL